MIAATNPSKNKGVVVLDNICVGCYSVRDGSFNKELS